MERLLKPEASRLGTVQVSAEDRIFEPHRFRLPRRGMRSPAPWLSWTRAATAALGIPVRGRFRRWMTSAHGALVNVPEAPATRRGGRPRGRAGGSWMWRLFEYGGRSVGVRTPRILVLFQPGRAFVAAV